MPGLDPRLSGLGRADGTEANTELALDEGMGCRDTKFESPLPLREGLGEGASHIAARAVRPVQRARKPPRHQDTKKKELNHDDATDTTPEDGCPIPTWCRAGGSFFLALVPWCLGGFRVEDEPMRGDVVRAAPSP